jgi:type I restriction enzyme R subunit
VKHFEDRLASLDGKAMIVCMSRRICVAPYGAILKLRPEWHSDDDEAGAIKVVMTGAASDPASWQRHIGTRAKARPKLLAKRAKDPNDQLRLVVVRDMWLTGFDAPAMHTMYVDKPMKGHGLMQANRPLPTITPARWPASTTSTSTPCATRSRPGRPCAE